MKYTKSYKKICAICGKEFVAHTALQKYCDAWCQYTKNLERCNEQRRKKRAAAKAGGEKNVD